MRSLALAALLATACTTAPPSPTLAKALEVHEASPLRLERGFHLEVVCEDVADVPSDLLASLVLSPLDTDGPSLAALGVKLDAGSPIAMTRLDGVQSREVFLASALHDGRRYQPEPVIVVTSGQALTVYTLDVPAIELVPTIVEDPRAVRLNVRVAEDTLSFTLRPEDTALLRVVPRHVVVQASVISLRDEEARRYTLDQD